MASSLYAFEHSAAFDIIFAFFFIIMAMLLCVSSLTTYRSIYGNVSKQVAKLNYVRYLCSFCCILQLVTFIGYYILNDFLHEFLWNIWVPSWILSFALLSYNISEIYLNTIHVARKKKKRKKKKKKKSNATVVWSKDETEQAGDPEIPLSDAEMTDYATDVTDCEMEPESSTETRTETTETSTNENRSSAITKKILLKEKIQPLFWKSVWFLWSAAAISQWFGSLMGWVFGVLLAQAFGYMFWKLISFIMLLLCVYVLYVVRQRIESALANTVAHGSRRMSKSLTQGMTRVRNLMICEIVLLVVFAISVVYEIYVMISIAEGHLVNNIYTESTLMSMCAYFPVWTGIHVVLCVYSWIDKESLHSETKKRTISATR